MELYLDASSQHAVNSNSQAVGWGEWTFGHGETAVRGVRLGSAVQHVLKSKGDRVNIDWGYLYLAVQNHSHSAVWAGSARTARSFFVKHGTVVPTPDRRQPRASANDMPCLSAVQKISLTSTQPTAAHFLIGYDDIASVYYFGDEFKAYWTQAYGSIELWLHKRWSVEAVSRSKVVSTMARLWLS